MLSQILAQTQNLNEVIAQQTIIVYGLCSVVLIITTIAIIQLVQSIRKRKYV